MSSLSTILLSVSDPEALVSDLARTVETHIAAKSGISGAAMKLGFNALRSAKPDIAARATRSLLPRVATALDPLYASFNSSRSADFGSFLSLHAEQAAGLVIDTIDARMGTSRNTAAKAIYKRFRGSAGDELQKLLPSLGRVIATHIG